MQALSACEHDIKEILRPCLLKWHPSFSTAYTSSGSWVEEFLFFITWRRCRHTSNPTILPFVSTINKWSIWENVRRVTLIASNKNKRIHRSSQSSHGFSSVFILYVSFSRQQTKGGGLVLTPWCAPSPCPPPKGRCQWLQSPPSPLTTPPPGLDQMGNTWFSLLRFFLLSQLKKRLFWITVWCSQRPHI